MSVTTCERVDARGLPCGGTFDEGVCDRCGRPQPKAAPLVTEASGAAPPASVVAARTPAGTGTRHGTSGGGTMARTGRRSGRRHTKGSTSRRQSLGGGLVSLPEVPSQDPLRLVLADPQVSLGKRRCPHCDARVSRAKGFCPQCSEAYDFAPKLRPGQLVAGKYEVKGPIAFGGMGWVYLGWDGTLSRWVVLKGLLNSGDREAVEAAVAERQFLASVKHPRIVGIHDFVTEGRDGYMVLEYVGGRTIESLREERGPFPPEVAMAYVLGILPAFSHLHAQGYVYCDFKPGNLMIEGGDVKLIDLGAVRRVGDPDGSVFGTDGYSARDASEEPSVSSDLYTIGRTLAVLVMDFLYRVQEDRDPVTGAVTTSRRMRADYVDRLPTPAEQPVLAANESLWRFLQRATHPDPDRRFQSADEMEAQLLGVLRQTVARTGGPRPSESRVFFGDGLAAGRDAAGAAAPLVRLLPLLRIDTGDRAAGELLGVSSVTDPDARVQALRGLQSRRPGSTEVQLRLADALLAVGMTDPALAMARAVLKDDEFEWRARWYAGKAMLAAHQADGPHAPDWATRAIEEFHAVRAELPGELAPILALAVAEETDGRFANAADHYRQVVDTDPSHASACFGLARVEEALGRPVAARQALSALPASHPAHGTARLRAAGSALASLTAPGPVGSAKGAATLVPAKDGHVATLARAAAAVDSVPDGTEGRSELVGRLFAAAAALLGAGMVDAKATPSVNGVPTEAYGLRRAGEAAFREAARATPDREGRARLLDMANAVRPVSLF